jgi:DNA-binding transcriptional ArsR family regulator
VASTGPTDLTLALGALMDPTRRAAVQRLAQGPATASQLAQLAPISRPAVSQHLKVLREAGLVRATQSGRHVWYELAGTRLLDTKRWLDSLIDAWADAPTLVDAARTSPTKEPA